MGHSGVGRSSSLSGAPQPCSLFCHTEEAHLQKGLQMSMKIQSFQQGKARFYNHAEKLNLRQESLFCFVFFFFQGVSSATAERALGAAQFCLAPGCHTELKKLAAGNGNQAGLRWAAADKEQGTGGVLIQTQSYLQDCLYQSA